MKKIIIAMMLCSFGFTMNAQDDYTPIFTEGREFTYEWKTDPSAGEDGISTREITTVSGDTILNNEVWTKCHAVTYSHNYGKWTLSGIRDYAILEKDRMVYRHIYYSYNPYAEEEEGEKFDNYYEFDPNYVSVIYNFNIKVGSKIDEYREVQKEDYIMVRDRKYRRLTMDDGYHAADIWVEGIGASQQFFSIMNSFHCLLTSVYENGELIFEYDDFFAPTYENSSSVKAIESVADSPATVFDLTGKRVSEPRKGVYIKDGKKVVKF